MLLVFFRFNGWMGYVKTIWCALCTTTATYTHTFQYQLHTGLLCFEYLSKTTIAFALVFFLSLWSNQNTDKEADLSAGVPCLEEGLHLSQILALLQQGDGVVFASIYNTK
jgi:hypothetical protein